MRQTMAVKVLWMVDGLLRIIIIYRHQCIAGWLLHTGKVIDGRDLDTNVLLNPFCNCPAQSTADWCRVPRNCLYHQSKSTEEDSRTVDLKRLKSPARWDNQLTLPWIRWKTTVTWSPTRSCKIISMIRRRRDPRSVEEKGTRCSSNRPSRTSSSRELHGDDQAETTRYVVCQWVSWRCWIQCRRSFAVHGTGKCSIAAALVWQYAAPLCCTYKSSLDFIS